MLIIGAGMSGLLAAHMLRRFNPVVQEAQGSLPNNHSALLRFRTDAVSRATGIPFKKVWVQKAICYKGKLYSEPNIAFANMYSSKVTGRVIGRSIMNLQPGERYIAPLDFIQQMAKGIYIRYDSSVEKFQPKKSRTIISTIPMQVAMNMVDWKEVPEFGFHSIYTITCDLDGVDIYQTLYYPGDDVPQYRASITGNKLMIEITKIWIDSSTNSIVNDVMRDFGIFGRVHNNIKVTNQKYGKIEPIESNIRKQFILALTDQYNIYSIGRFATWRQILMDDVVRDISLVEQMISERSAYASHLPTAV